MNQFAHDVVQGLSAQPKFLSSKYFYDKNGDRLFQKIMELDEYYLTRSEFEIFNRHKDDLLRHFTNNRENFQLIELGAGDGLKTKVLLSHFLEEGAHFRYMPIDISQNALDGLMKDLEMTYPDLEVQAINDDYVSALHNLKEIETGKIVMFLGSNIGNFNPSQALSFLQKMNAELNPGDQVLIGFDLKKDPDLIRQAYNDPQGITKQFNLNLLRRINSELGADFDLNAFEHDPSYNPETGEALSYLRSLKDQTVTLEKLRKCFKFTSGEKIFMEISQKYSVEEILALASNSGFEAIEHFFDSRGYFVDTLWRIK